MDKTIPARIAAPVAGMVDRFLRLGESGQTADEASRIRAIRLSVMGATTPWMMSANLCNAILTLFAFQDSPSSTSVSIICILICTVALYTSYSWWRNRKRGARERASMRGTIRAVVYAFFLSALWAALDIVAYHTADETQRMVLIALTVPPASIVFCSTIAVGAAIALSREPSVLEAYLLVLYLVFAAIIIRSSLAVCNSLTERVRAKLAADEQRDVINLLLNDFEENAADWLWGVDHDMNMERASIRFYEQLQVPEAMVVGKPLTNIIPFSSVGIDGYDCRQNFVTCLEKRQSFRDQDICVELGGELAIWSLTAKAIKAISTDIAASDAT
jgi:hypothetical protein